VLKGAVPRNVTIVIKTLAERFAGPDQPQPFLPASQVGAFLDKWINQWRLSFLQVQGSCFNLHMDLVDVYRPKEMTGILRPTTWICDSSMLGKSSKQKNIFSQMVRLDGDESHGTIRTK